MAARGPHRTTARRAAAVLAAALGLAAAAAAIPPDVRAKLKRYESPYYIIYSDLDAGFVREAYVRMTAMAREYHQRTKGFAGTIRRKLAFYLFSDRRDYERCGGVANSSGVYMGDRLMAVAGKGGGFVWHTVQHEGFHQFAHRVIRGGLPVWVNEGLAEYFGHGIWTGDNFVTGVIPSGRLARVRKHIRDKKILPFLEMLTMDQKAWNSDLAVRNYDQAWSMVQFLVHADDGKYRRAFADFINDISRGRPWRQAFVGRFGRNVEAFQQRYAEWWTSLPDRPTSDLYVKAVVETLTSYLARAHATGLKFADADEFLRAAREGRIEIDPKRHPKLWLPGTLLAGTLKLAAQLRGWSLEPAEPLPRLVLARGDGKVYRGSFTLPHDGAPTVTVTIEPAGARPAPAPTAPATRPAG